MDAGNTKITIINKALSHIKVANITSLDQVCEPARQANLFYDCVRKSTLRACDWRFATKKILLNLLGTVEQAQLYPADLSKQDYIPGWLYTYAYPAGCARLRKIFNAEMFYNITPFNDRSLADRSAKINLFEICRSPRTDVIAVGCNLPNVSAEITADITDESQFDDMFQDSISWGLAEELCIPLSCDMEMQQYVAAESKKCLEEAKRKNGGEGTEMAPRQSNYEAVRD
jgi:hypothetical protein